MSKWIHGRAVQNGRVRFLSASSLQLADASTATGCVRRWWYQYIQGLKEEPSKSMQAGIDMHERLEQYLRSGDRSKLGSLELSGLHMMPPGGTPGLLVEHSLVPKNPTTGQEDLDLAPLRVVGNTIPVLGKIDLLHGLGINFGTDDVEQQNDPEGTLETDDHKRVSSLEYVKSASEIPDTIQMALYGKYAFSLSPAVKRVRLALLYYPVRGTSRKVSTLVEETQLEPAWQRIEAIGAAVRDAALETNPDKVDANVRACRSYGRDCPARQICRAAKHNSLETYVGATAAERILDSLPDNTFSISPDFTHMPAPMTLVERLKAAAANTSSTPITIPASSIAPPPQQPTPQPEVQAEIDRLVTQQQNVVPQGPDLVAMIGEITSFNKGFPTLAGRAAVAIADLGGFKISEGAGLAGQGALSKRTVKDIADLPALLALLKSGAPLDVEDVQPTNPQIATGTDASVESHASAGASAGTDATTTEAPTEKPKRTRKKKEEAAAPPPPIVMPNGSSIEEVVAAVAAANAIDAAAAVAVPTIAPDDQRTYLYVDCSIDGLETKSLWPLIHHISTELSAATGGDYRASKQFEYGKWKPGLASALRIAHSRGKIPPGHWALDGANTETALVVVETMRELLNQTGGVLIRGTR